MFFNGTIMKKILLLSAVTLFAANGFAQKQATTPVSSKMRNVATSSIKELKTATFSGFKNNKAPRKSAVNGVYYNRPSGTFYTGMKKDGRGHFVNYLVIPPSYNPVFVNRSTNPASTVWMVNGNPQDASSGVLANGDLEYGTLSSKSDSYFYLPELTLGTISYNLGESGEDYGTKGPAFMLTDSIDSHTYFDDVTAGRYGWGLFTHTSGANEYPYLYGSGTYTEQDGTVYKNLGLVQFVDKPASPLYVEDIFSMMYSSSRVLTGDAELKLQVVSATKGEDGWELGDKTIATLTAVPADTIHLVGPTQTSYGPVNITNVVFTQKGTDELGLPTTIPFTIDEPFALVLTGFADEGVDVDVICSEEVAEDNLNTTALPIIQKDDEEPVISQFYNGSIVWNCNFTSCFDGVNVAESLNSYDETTGEILQTYTDQNVLRVSADGQTVYTDGTTPGSDEDLGGAYVSTAFPYYDADGNTNYYSDDLPDWISDLTVQEFNSDDANIAIVTPICDPLPAGTTGRKAEFFLKGKGVTSEHSVIVLQGDATNGIDGVSITDVKETKSNKIYNLNGQQVDKNYKGVVIKNGKKVINNK